MTKTTKICIGAFLAMIAAIATVGYLGVLLKGQGATLTENMQRFVDDEVRKEERAALERLLEETASERTRMQQFILDGEDDTIAFLSEVDGLAAALGVELATEKLEVQPIEDAAFDTLLVTFAVDGAEESVVRLLTLLESLPYHSHVAEASVNRRIDEMTGVAHMEGTILFTLTMRKAE